VDGGGESGFAYLLRDSEKMHKTAIPAVVGGASRENSVSVSTLAS
jgi:hypothetical protein